MHTKQYGSWSSPITAATAAQAALKFSEIAFVGQQLYWLENRPQEQGRVALMSWNSKTGESELLPKEYSVRSRVHEYGGGALLVTPGVIYFVNDKNQQIYSVDVAGTIKQVTNKPGARFADGNASTRDGSLFYVMEYHDTNVINSIVTINPATGDITAVAEGNDFYSNPRVSPDGTKLAYITWHHPNLPWDDTELWVVDIATGEQHKVAGDADESIANPIWSSTGQLYYVSDKTNWWNVYRTGEANSPWSLDAEFIKPQWLFNRTLLGCSGDMVIAGYIQQGITKFAQLLPDGAIAAVDIPFTDCGGIAVEGGMMAAIVNTPIKPSSIIIYDLDKHQYATIKQSGSFPFDTGFVSNPVLLEYPSYERTSYAFYYPPANPNYQGLAGENPPLLVHAHGGPTANAVPNFSLEVLYWTSRGFAVLDVNYGGSTGFGRAYRNVLKHQWGVVDVQDCVAGALYCVQQGLADREKLAIAGGSAGGFTVLSALAFYDVFKVGANHFGVTDLTRFIEDTHKFEERYLEQLIGVYPQAAHVYKERSPIHSIDRISCPVIIFQGDEDAIVPPSQSALIYESLRKKNIETEYHLYQGEQHGFRKASNIEHALENQLRFFMNVLKIQ